MSKVKYKITDPQGNFHHVTVLSKWLKEHNLQEHGFRKVLRGLQTSCYGGYTIEKAGDTATQKSAILSIAQEHFKKPVLVDVFRRENGHKIKFTTANGKTTTRKLTISKVDNLKGLRCSFTGNNILLGELVGKCVDSQDNNYNISIAELKKMGYTFDLDFSSPRVVEKIVEKPVEVVKEISSPQDLEKQLKTKMTDITKEIRSVQDKLTKLKTIKESVGKSLAQIQATNSALRQFEEITR